MQEPVFRPPRLFFMAGRLWAKPEGCSAFMVYEQMIVDQIAEYNRALGECWEALGQYRQHRDLWDAQALQPLDELADEVKRNLGG